jgi:ABC-type sugar transport system substrate-binding protein
MSRPKVVASFLSKEQEFQVMQAADAQVAAARAGFDVEVVYAEQNAVQQIHQLFKFIHAPAEERPFAIVVETVVGEGLERVARNATRAGISWVLLNRRVTYLEALRNEYPHLAIAAVTSDQLSMGRMQGRQFQALLPKGGNVLYIQGPPDTSAAQERLQGARETTQGTGIELRILEGDWTAAGAEKAVTNALRLKTAEALRPDLVGAQNDTMAMGARDALLALRPDWARVPFTGCDGLPEGGQRLVNVKQLAATIVSPSNSGPAIDLLARWLKTKEQPPARIVLTPTSYPPEEELRQRGATRGGPATQARS